MGTFGNSLLAVILFVILGVSFILAKCARRKMERQIVRQEVPASEAYLFRGNSALLAISSNIGTLFSICLVFGIVGATFNGKVGGIWSTTTPLFIALVLFMILFSSVRFLGRWTSRFQSYFFSEETQRAPAERMARVSIIQYIADYYSPNGARGQATKAFSLFYVFNAFLTLSLELAMLRIVLLYGLGIDGDLANVVVFLVFVFCHFYVFVGGFRGVLLTDAFQLLVIGVLSLALIGFGVAYARITGHGLEHVGMILQDRTFDPDVFRRTRIEVVWGVLGMTAYMLSNYDIWTRSIRTPVLDSVDRSIRHARSISRRIIFWSIVALAVLVVSIIVLTLVAMYDFGAITDAIHSASCQPGSATASGFLFPLKLCAEIFASKSPGGNLGEFLTVLAGKTILGLNALDALRYCIAFFLVLIAITTISTELISMGQIFHVGFSRTVFVRKIGYQQFILYLAPFSFAFSYYVRNTTFGDWGAYWIAQLLIIAPALIAALFSLSPGGSWRVVRWPFAMSMASTFVLFVTLLFRPSIMEDLPALLILVLFFAPTALVLSWLAVKPQAAACLATCTKAVRRLGGSNGR